MRGGRDSSHMALLSGWLGCTRTWGVGPEDGGGMPPTPGSSWPGCRGSWAGPPPSPIDCAFSLQILGAVILGFGVWILADRSSFISVLRKGLSDPPARLALGRWARAAGRAVPGELEPQSGSLFPLPSGPRPGPALTTLLRAASAGVFGRNFLSLPTQSCCCLENTGVEGGLLSQAGPFPSALTLRESLLQSLSLHSPAQQDAGHSPAPVSAEKCRKGWERRIVRSR